MICRVQCQINQAVKGSTGEWRMCHTSPLRARAQQGPGEVRGADKAGLSGRNQSQMWSGPRHGGPTTSALSGVGGEEGVVGEEGAAAGWPLTQSREEPRANADSCHGRGRRPAIISLAHTVLRALSRCLLNRTFKTLVAFIQCFKVAAALLPSHLFTFLLFCNLNRLYYGIAAPQDTVYYSNL